MKEGMYEYVLYSVCIHVCMYIYVCIPGQEIAESSGEVLDVFRMLRREELAHEFHGTHTQGLRLHHLGDREIVCKIICTYVLVVVVVVSRSSSSSSSF